MNEAHSLQAAAWLGAHALVPYAAVSLLLVAMTLFSWRLLKQSLPSFGTRLAMACALAGLGSAAFTWLAVALLDGPALSVLDQVFTDALARSVPSGVVQAAALLTRLGDPATLGVLGVAVGAALLLRRHGGLMLGWAAAQGGNGLLNPALKQLFARLRPLQAAEGASAHGFSFPSGHSSALLVAVLLAFSVGVGRIILRVHYASDVAAGFASGTAWLAACVAGIEFARWLRHRGAGQSRPISQSTRTTSSTRPKPPLGP